MDEGYGSRYLAIDLKSFYASVECVDRGLDPLEARLVVADPSRGESTICLAVSPALKAQGCPGRPRVRDIPDGLEYLMVRPRMRRYMEVSAQIVSIYLRHVSEEDLHVYSVDECFIDVGPYLRLYGTTPRGMALFLMDEVRRETGIYATAGIGTNLFLAKVALDLLAKHSPDMIGELDEASFRERVWRHRPITDIWGISTRTARRLEAMGARDLLHVALLPRDALVSEFGVRGGALHDHSWGAEPTTMVDIKAYRPCASSISNGQVLPRDYSCDQARLVLGEMCDEAALKLAERRCAATGVSVWVGYSFDAWDEGAAAGASGSRRLAAPTDSREAIRSAVGELWGERVDPTRPVRRLGIALTGLVDASRSQDPLFGPGSRGRLESAVAGAEVAIRRRFGRAAVFRGVDLMPGATALERAGQVGGHHE